MTKTPTHNNSIMEILRNRKTLEPPPRNGKHAKFQPKFQSVGDIRKMGSFREENRFLIYYTNVFGLYMTSIESVTDSKWLIGFFTLWTKIPITILPVYICWDFRSLIFDQMTVLSRFAMVRKIFVFCGFFLKNVLFYYQREKIEELIELWDDSFKENFYPEEELMNKKKNQKENKKLLRGSLFLAVLAALSYSVPSFFSKMKTITHPSGLIYPHRSPEFEIAVMFDVCASLSCVSAAAFDCILIVFLSQIRSKLEFLTETLIYIVDEVAINEEGKLMGRRTRRQVVTMDLEYPERDVQLVGRIRNEYSPEMDDYYEETEKKSVEFERNMANVEKKLRIWILHHQQTIFFFEQVSKVYSNIATFELGYIVIYTGLTALNVVQMKLSLVALGIALVASSNLMSLFLWCKLSGGLMDIDPFSEAFGRSWFLYPRKIITAFSFIIMRSKKRLSLKGFSIVRMNLITFFEILKLTYQFFAFMVQITAKES